MKQIKVYQNESYKELGILYGLFFEDLNHAADGGLYAEMVQNRSFEYCETDRKDYHALTAWERTGELEWEVQTGWPLHPDNPHYLHVEVQPGSAVCNKGYNTGIFVEEGKCYDFSMYAGHVEGSIRICVSVETEDASVCAKSVLTISGSAWQKYELQLRASQTTTCGRLVLTFETSGTCDLDMISLFPQETFLGKKAVCGRISPRRYRKCIRNLCVFPVAVLCMTAV